MSDKMVEEMALAIEPRAWEAFDGYVEVFAGALKGYTAEQKREAFIYGSPLVKGHDWGRTLQHSLEAAQAAATIAERRMEEMRAERDKWKQRAFELECEHGVLKGVFVESRAALRPSGGV
jgi:hypothetical protein